MKIHIAAILITSSILCAACGKKEDNWLDENGAGWQVWQPEDTDASVDISKMPAGEETQGYDKQESSELETGLPDEAEEVSDNKETSEEEYRSERIDVEKYYEENGTIISRIDAGTSQGVQTETEVIAELSARGLEMVELTSEYSISGKYHSPEYISNSDIKHPAYQGYYSMSEDSFWTISMINGQITAYPVLYNMQSTKDAPLMIAESKQIMGYDSATNSFYETIPDATTLIVLTVDRIDADTLNALTIDVIDNLYEEQNK